MTKLRLQEIQLYALNALKLNQRTCREVNGKSRDLNVVRSTAQYSKICTMANCCKLTSRFGSTNYRLARIIRLRKPDGTIALLQCFLL